MSPRSKKEYTESVFLRYKKASRKEKNLILNEFCATLDYHRKHAIRVLRKFKRFRKSQNHKPGRAPFYSQPQILKPLNKIWLTANLPCSKRLKAILPIRIPGYNELFGPLTPEVSQALLQISPATIDRILSHSRIRYKQRGRSTTKPGTLLRKQIPIQTNQWNESRPGFLEADTVAHCGDSLSGIFAYTIDFVDIATHWGTERSAHWVLDVDLREDDSRVRTDHAPANLTVLRHLALYLLHAETTKEWSTKGNRELLAR